MNDTANPSFVRFSRLALGLAVILAGTAIGVRYWPVAEPVPTETAAPTADARAAIAELEARLKASPNDADLWSSLGEALVTAGPGTSFPSGARVAFDRAITLNPQDPRARYFLAMAKDMGGNPKGAIDDWIALLRDSPSGAPWEGDVRRTVEAIAAREKIDVTDRLAALRPATGGPDQAAMIAAMVDGLAAKLAADPINVEGWIMLMRSYATLGRADDARAALAKAKTANPASAQELDAAAKELGL